MELNVFILVGIFSLYFMSVLAKVSNNMGEYDEETEALIRDLLKIRRRPTVATTTTTTPEPETMKSAILSKGTAINLNIIVVPVLHEKMSSGRNQGRLEVQSIPDSSGGRPVVNSLFGDRANFHTSDEDDLEAEESSYTPASTPAPGIIHPTRPTRPSCRTDQRYDPDLRQCISSRGGACPKCRRRHAG